MKALLDPFVDMFRKGWEDGAKIDLRPPGPTVGRGLFSNPFLSERERERRKLKAQYRRAKKAHQDSIFGDEASVDAALIEVFKGACARAHVFDTAWAVDAAHIPIGELLWREFFVFPELSDEDFRGLTLRESSALRTFLARRERHLQSGQVPLHLAEQALETLLADFLEAAPEGFATSTEPGALRFNAALLDLMEKPVPLIERTWQALFAKDLCDRDLFAEWREQLRHNTLVASGLDPRDQTSGAKKVKRPTELRDKSPADLVSLYLGETPLADLFDATVPITVPNELRFEHCHILGGTGHGKSQLLLNLIRHDLYDNPERPALLVIDSQGDLIRTLSRLSIFDPDHPESQADRLVLVDPADVEFPACLNLFDVARGRLDSYGPADRERLQNGVVELFEYMFSALLGAELTQKQGVIFKFLARLLLAIPDSTIHTLLRIMEDGRSFKPHMEKLEGVARHFFEREFFDPSFAQTKKQIAKRLWGVLANPVFERMFSHPQNKLDLFEALQSGKVVLINAAKDLLKTEGAAIFGRFFIAQAAQAALERAALPEGARRPTFIYVDEAQDYLDENIAQLVNQARKYRVGLTFAHQNLDQLTPALRASVQASTSIKFAGGVSAKDARALAEDMHADSEFLLGMRKRRGTSEFACYAKNLSPRALRISVPLGQVNTLPSMSDEAYETLLERNRDRYCAPLVRQLPAPPPPQEAPPPEPIAEPQTEIEAKPSQPDSEPHVTAPTPERKRTPREDPYIAGQGGKEHKYLQQLVRAAAQERGFLATIEAPVTGGVVDVAIEGHGTKIACEVSATTDAAHELGNVRKGLSAGFPHIWLIAASPRRRDTLAKAIEAQLDEGARSRFKTLSVEAAIALLDEVVADAGTKTATVRGYKVKVTRKPLDPEEAKRRREAIARVVAKSAKNLREKD